MWIGKVEVSPKSGAPYTVSGIEADGVRRSYEKLSLEDAGYLASKMKDNGVRDTCIHDAGGNHVPASVALKAFVRRRGR